MKTRHKLLQDFQFTSSDKKIFVLKTGIILDEYIFKSKDGEILIDKEIVNNNQLYFQVIDWKSELLTYIKSQKIAQPAVLSKKLIPFIEDMILSSMQSSPEPIIIFEEQIKRLDAREKVIGKKEVLLKESYKGLDEDQAKRESELSKREISLKESYKILDEEMVQNKEQVKRLDKRESELNDRERASNKKEVSLKELYRGLDEIQSDIENKLRARESSKDVRYIEIQKKLEDWETKHQKMKDELYKPPIK